jgi:hypothetical protein
MTAERTPHAASRASQRVPDVLKGSVPVQAEAPLLSKPLQEPMASAPQASSRRKASRPGQSLSSAPPRSYASRPEAPPVRVSKRKRDASRFDKGRSDRVVRRQPSALPAPSLEAEFDPNGELIRSMQ